MKDLMMLFGVTLAKRYTVKQKNIFLSQAHQYFVNLGYKINYQSTKSKLNSVTNMVIGDIDKADIAVVCPYDTPSSVVLPNYLYYPFNTKKNLQQENINIIIQFILMALCFAGIYFLFLPFNTYSASFKTVSVIICGILAFISYKLMKGSPSKVNFNRCSASVALIAKLAGELKNHENIAFVLLDKSVNSFEGLKLLQQELKNSKKKILYLDSLASGEKLVCAHGEEMNETAALLVHHLESLNIINRTYEPQRCEEIMLRFSSGMLVLTSGEIIHGQLAVRNARSGRDYELDMDRLEKIEERLEAFLCEV